MAIAKKWPSFQLKEVRARVTALTDVQSLSEMINVRAAAKATVHAVMAGIRAIKPGPHLGELNIPVGTRSLLALRSAKVPLSVRQKQVCLLLVEFKCPKCTSTEIYKSHERNFIEVAFSLVVIACRCYGCDRRFFRPRLYGRLPGTAKPHKSARASSS